MSVKEKHRMEKYPETETFVFENMNPKGNVVGDCVVRAVSLAMDKSWDEVYDGLCEIGKKMKRMPNDKQVYGKYLEVTGWKKMKQPRKPDNTKYTGKEWCEWMNENHIGTVIAHIGGHHVVCIKLVNGKYKVHDIWNSTGGCIGNYWAAP